MKMKRKPITIIKKGTTREGICTSIEKSIIYIDNNIVGHEESLKRKIADKILLDKSIFSVKVKG